MGEEGRSRMVIPKPTACVIVQSAIIDVVAKRGVCSCMLQWVTYSVLHSMGKKEYLHQPDGGFGSGGDEDDDVELKRLNAAF